MRGRGYGEHVENQVLAKRIPARFEKAALRLPPMREKEGMSIEHPREINALVNLGCQPHDLLIMTKLLTRGQDASQKERRINGRDFAHPAPRARLRIQPVIEPTVKLLGALRKKTERCACALFRIMLV